jgi:RNA recognition motif-containing protein
MSTRIYVENLPAATTPGDLINLFAPFGNVVDVNIATDRDNFQPLGYGFVTMVTSEGAHAAIQGLNGRQLGKRSLIVTELRPPSLGSVGAPGSPKPPVQHAASIAVFKKNGILPSVTGQDGKRATE